jgi:hypothetical protein
MWENSAVLDDNFLFHDKNLKRTVFTCDISYGQEGNNFKPSIVFYIEDEDLGVPVENKLFPNIPFKVWHYTDRHITERTENNTMTSISMMMSEYIQKEIFGSLEFDSWTDSLPFMTSLKWKWPKWIPSTAENFIETYTKERTWSATLASGGILPYKKLADGGFYADKGWQINAPHEHHALYLDRDFFTGYEVDKNGFIFLNYSTTGLGSTITSTSANAIVPKLPNTFSNYYVRIPLQHIHLQTFNSEDDYNNRFVNDGLHNGCNVPFTSPDWNTYEEQRYIPMINAGLTMNEYNSWTYSKTPEGDMEALVFGYDSQSIYFNYGFCDSSTRRLQLISDRKLAPEFVKNEQVVVNDTRYLVAHVLNRNAREVDFHGVNGWTLSEKTCYSTVEAGQTLTCDLTVKSRNSVWVLNMETGELDVHDYSRVNDIVIDGGKVMVVLNDSISWIDIE